MPRLSTESPQQKLQHVIDLLTRWRDNPKLHSVELHAKNSDLEPKIVDRCVVYAPNPDFRMMEITLHIMAERDKDTSNEG